DGFMLMCTSHGVQWQLGEEGDDQYASQQLPCVQCGAHLASVQSFPYSPPAPAVAPPPQRPRFAELLALSPPFLVAPPNRAPPLVS
ncbi:MAG: hypothetical protein ACRCTL_11510, partial [Pseudomonas sp.]